MFCIYFFALLLYMSEQEILVQLKNITERLDRIESDVMYLKKSSKNMDNHISFIESVYDTVKYPFYYIMNKVHRINDLPIKQKHIEQ